MPRTWHRVALRPGEAAGLGVWPLTRPSTFRRMQASSYEAMGSLRDGMPVRIRAIQREDKEALRWGFSQLSKDAIYHRFFQVKQEITEEELRYLTELDFRDHVALVVEAEVDGLVRVIGVGRFVRLSRLTGRADRAEIAFIVGDEFQGRGVATLLLTHLTTIARELGYVGFEAEVLPDNRLMLEVFQNSGLEMRRNVRDGLVHVELSLGPGSFHPA
jgi:RimJ/RimL family protein N-acetyltransferase